MKKSGYCKAGENEPTWGCEKTYKKKKKKNKNINLIGINQIIRINHGGIRKEKRFGEKRIQIRRRVLKNLRKDVHVISVRNQVI